MWRDITRSELRKGMYINEGFTTHRYTWENTFHESSLHMFASKQYTCDECGAAIQVGDYMSQGSRQLMLMDDDVPVAGIDRIHAQCGERHGTDKRTIEDMIRDIDDITSVSGWPQLSLELKSKYLNLRGEEVTEKALNTKQVFMKCIMMISGEMPRRWEIENKICEEGGVVSKNVVKSLTHLVAGESGVNEYGQATGPASKKFKEAKKIKGIVVLTPDQVWDAVKMYEQDGIPLIERTNFGTSAAKPEPKKKSSKDSHDEARKAAPKAKGGAKFAFSDEKDGDETMEVQPEPPKPTRASKRKSMPSQKFQQAQAGADEPQPEPPTKKAKQAHHDDRDDTHPSSSDLSSLTRKQLQALAKKHGLKANGSNDTLIQQLQTIQSSI